MSRRPPMATLSEEVPPGCLLLYPVHFLRLELMPRMKEFISSALPVLSCSLHICVQCMPQSSASLQQKDALLSEQLGKFGSLTAVWFLRVPRFAHTEERRTARARPERLEPQRKSQCCYSEAASTPADPTWFPSPCQA